MPGELMRLLGAIPSYYLRYFYFHRAGRASSQTEGTPRAREVMEIEAELLEMYRDPELARSPKLLEERGGAFYSEAAAHAGRVARTRPRRRPDRERRATTARSPT